MLNMVLPENFDKQVFLRDYWQKKPLLIRAGTQPFVDLIEPEELAGLACEEGVESRLVQVDDAQENWTLRQGPFTEQDFLELPETHYSLLVQAVDQWVDDVAALLEDFDFIPGWRIDDVMISYATDQGNVGPHFDYYDVFLIQGMGQKRWQIGAACNSMTPRRDDSGQRLLKDFTPIEEWVVNPGDILYLPPGISHYGVSLGKSMTYSVGFRAPSHADILSGVLDSALDNLTEDQRYTDASPRLPLHPGEITPDVVDNLRELIRSLMDDPVRVRQWFGKTMTAPRYPLQEQDSCCDHEHEHEHEHEHLVIENRDDLSRALTSGAALYKVPGARFAYAVTEDAAELYADGECYPCGLHLLTLLQALSTPGKVDEIDSEVVHACLPDTEAAELLLTLHKAGSLVTG